MQSNYKKDRLLDSIETVLTPMLEHSSSNFDLKKSELLERVEKKKIRYPSLYRSTHA